MAKGVFERKKPHVNVGTIGHIDHGKTTLTAALSARSQAKFGTTAKNYKDIAKGGTERDATKTVTISAAHVAPSVRPVAASACAVWKVRSSAASAEENDRLRLAGSPARTSRHSTAPALLPLVPAFTVE